MKNTFIDFLEYCGCHGVLLTREQARIAKEFFGLSVGGGKSTLVSLLYGYDPVAYRVKADLDQRFSELQIREHKIGISEK